MNRRGFFKKLGAYSAVVGALPAAALSASACDDGQEYDDYGDHDPCDETYEDNYDDCWDYLEAYEDTYFDSGEYVDGTEPGSYADYLNGG